MWKLLKNMRKIHIATDEHIVSKYLDGNEIASKCCLALSILVSAGIFIFGILNFLALLESLDASTKSDRFNNFMGVGFFFYAGLLMEALLHILENGLFKYCKLYFPYVDMVTACTGLTASIKMFYASQYVGALDERVSRSFFVPYNSWHEETALAQMETDSESAMLFGISMMFLTCRLFKFLSVMPMLAVPFDALRLGFQSPYPVPAFAFVLILLSMAFCPVRKNTFIAVGTF